MTAAVVTGIGVAAPNGLGKDTFWAATLRGESGIGTVRRFDVSRYPSRLGGEIGDFEPTDYLAGRLIPQTDRMTQIPAGWSTGSGNLTTCGGKAPSTSACTCRSPGSTPSTPGRSRSGTACAARPAS